MEIDDFCERKLAVNESAIITMQSTLTVDVHNRWKCKFGGLTTQLTLNQTRLRKCFFSWSTVKTKSPTD